LPSPEGVPPVCGTEGSRLGACQPGPGGWRTDRPGPRDGLFAVCCGVQPARRAAWQWARCPDPFDEDATTDPNAPLAPLWRLLPPMM